MGPFYVAHFAPGWAPFTRSFPPCSGTTLAEQILASHDRVVAGGERRNIGYLIEWLGAEFGAEVGFPLFLRGKDGTALRPFRDRFMRERVPTRSSGRLLTDKTPGNYLNLGLIALFFPHARIIHCTRDPLDTCVPCYFRDFIEIPYSTDLRTLAFVYREYWRLMSHWSTLLDKQLYELNYEDLVTNPGPSIRKLLEFCGLPWSPACLDFHVKRRSVSTASSVQVKSPICTNSIGRWRHYEKFIRGLIDDLSVASPG